MWGSRADRPLEVARRCDSTTVTREHRPHLHAGKRRGPRHLPIDDVRPRVEQDLGARGRVHPESGLIRHGAAGKEQTRLLSEQRGHSRLESPYRRIAIEDVVADLCLGHRSPHRGSRTGDGVGAEIDDGARGRHGVRLVGSTVGR